MLEHRKHSGSPRRNTSARRVVDWAAVGGLLFDWLIAVGEFAFGVLLCGLLGGYLGTFLDAALSFFGERWAGQGRAWGWILGALAAAIGLPLGWIERDGKKFSFPSPRKLRKKISAGVRSQRKKKTETHDFQNVADVLKGGGILGLIGAVLGFFLGGALAISWFSLAMSPWDIADWSESLEFGAEREFDDHWRRHGHDRRTAVSTDNRLALYLWFTPVLGLGGLGAAVGTLYGATQFMRYLTGVPAAVRERQRAKKRLPAVSEAEATAAAIEQRLPVLASPPRWVPLRAGLQLLRGGIGLALVVGVLFFVAGLIFTSLLVIGWRDNPSEVPPVAVTFAVIFLVAGLAATTACLGACRRNVTILRRGYISRCQIVECKDPQTDRWKPYETLLEELRAVWDKPIAAVTREVTTKYEFAILGIGWQKTETNTDIKGFQRFMTFLVWFCLLIFTVIGAAGVMMTGVLIYVAVVQREPLAWWALLFVAAWWTVLVLMARIFFRQARVLIEVDKRSLKEFGVEPVVDCRARFALPDGKTADFVTKIDLSRRLAPGKADPADIAVYDPFKPTQALLCGSFLPALVVGKDGQWQFAQPHDETEQSDTSPPASNTSANRP